MGCGPGRRGSELGKRREALEGALSEGHPGGWRGALIMCGIAGIVSRNGQTLAGLRAMSSAIAHRGPNGAGYLLHTAAGGAKIWHNSEPEDRAPFTSGLSFRRLAV